MKRLLLDLARLAGMQFALAAAGIVRYKVLAVRLGADGLGEFQQLVVAAGTVTVLVSFGLGVGLNRNVAAHPGREERQTLLATANFIVCALGFVASAVLAVSLLERPEALGHLGVPAVSSVRWAAVLLLLLIPLDALKNNIVAFLLGALDVGGMTAGRSVAVLVATALSMPLVWGVGLVGAVLQLGCITVFLLVVLGRRCSHLGFAPFQVTWNRPAAATLAAFGAAALTAAFAQQLGDLIVRTQLVRQYGLAENGYYQAALLLIGQVQTIVLGGVGSYAIANLSQTADRESIINTTNLLLRGVLPIAILALSAVGLLALPLLIVLYAPPFSAATRFIPLLVGAFLLEAFVWVIGAPLLAIRRIRLWLSLDLIYFTLRAAAGVALLPVLGPQAVVTGYFLAMCVHLGLHSYAYFRVLGYDVDARHIGQLAIGVPLVMGLAWVGCSRSSTWIHYALAATVWLGYLTFMVQRHMGFDRARELVHRLRPQAAP
jgi:O-antigen/teichoic acid export membrane protein